MRSSSVDQAIVQVLATEHAHLTSSQVYEEIRSRLPAVNPSTVYRALERLTRNGKVSVSDMGTGSAVYELVSGEIHHHLVCQNCGRVMTLSNAEVKNFFTTIQNQNHFDILTNHLILFGICEECRKNGEKNSENN
ncbi:Fe2+/Zn2+ uptake regulation protein [Longilinea arvoryzae]|uniref:Fe2+/Zn2+ uptake regulation protein n=1 Tax=Longilinea arvoryzae TaxID=360412 RepID=A0A0S7B9W2_9CHLR|nr:transcriptional repressor [Longilinea arvoryzae]GAP14332.1 Fe2+/Zn2+ uptake regulation protein [Longilinea arvoryzae]